MTAGEFSVAIFSWVLQSENYCPAQSQAKCLFYRIFSEWYYIIIIFFFLKIPVHKGIQGMIKHDQTTQEELKPFFSAMAYNLLKRAFKEVFFKYIYQQLLKFCSDFGGSF